MDSFWFDERETLYNNLCQTIQFVEELTIYWGIP